MDQKTHRASPAGGEDQPLDGGAASLDAVAPLFSAGRCKCGQGPHPTKPGYCAWHHPFKGTPGPAVVTAKRSVAFWRAVEDAKRTIVLRVLSDHGYAEDDAPEGLRHLAVTHAESVLLKASTWDRMIEGGGPLSADARTRRCYEVWANEAARVITTTRALGLSRVPRATQTLADVLEAHEDSGGSVPIDTEPKWPVTVQEPEPELVWPVPAAKRQVDIAQRTEPEERVPARSLADILAECEPDAAPAVETPVEVVQHTPSTPVSGAWTE